MILTHGANSLERGGTGDILYLSYFNNLNVQTLADTPIVGSSATTEYYGTAGKTVRKFKGQYINFICNGGTGSQHFVQRIIPASNTPNIFSLEWLDYFPTYYNGQSATYKGLEAFINSISKRIVSLSSMTDTGVFTVNDQNNQLSSGWEKVDTRTWSESSSYSGKYTYIKNSSVMTIKQCHHFACVFDFNENKLYLYVDGNLANINNFSSLGSIPIDDVIIMLRNYNDMGWWTLCTQFCVFGFDKSTNNRANYPVPLSLYHDFPQPTTETIGGKQYRTVLMPDGKIWMADNLDFAWEGLNVGSHTGSYDTPMANYLDYDATNYHVDCIEPLGLLYNWAAVKYLNDNKSTLIPGWHIPTQTELSDLSSAIGGNSISSKKLKDMAYAGTNDYDFNMTCPGWFRNGNFNEVFTTCCLWLADEYDSDEAMYAYFWKSTDTATFYHYYKDCEFSIRLVKDT